MTTLNISPRIVAPASRKLTVGGTIPLIDATTEAEFLTFLAFNITAFPHVRYRGWLDSQKPGIIAVAKMCPPTKAYRLVGDGRLCAISGYKDDGMNSARIAVVVLGEDSPQFVDAIQLIDASKELADSTIGIEIAE